jgi:diguanylate cyclase (GGDEF)-like protein/putative nucleotidyltransferase with HDIG domain
MVQRVFGTLSRSVARPTFQPRRAYWIYVLLASVGVATHAAFALAGATNAVVDNWLYCALFFVAAGGCAHRARHGDACAAWTVATVGLSIWGIAEIVFRVTTPDLHALYPPATQALLFVAFTLAYTTLGLLARERVRRFDTVLALDGALAGLATAAVAAILRFPLMHQTRAAAPPRLFLLGALVGLLFVITVLGMTGWNPGRAWATLVVAIVVNVCGDIVLVHLANAGHFHRGSPADTLFVSSALLMGLAAFSPIGHGGVPDRPARRLPVPLVSSAAAFAVAAAAVARNVSGVAASLALAALGLMIVRMSVALDLLERSRGEALTDSLTRLGNRRLLTQDLEGRLGSGNPPFTLALFDLDGFKRYNDTFGHPSGDALLVRLAGHLARAVTPGVAYRMGGDEFCAILEGVGTPAQEALTRAHEALSERGDAFSIRSSSGIATCPAEADTVRDALRVADARMYAAKTTRDLTQAQTRDAILMMLQERDPVLHEHMRGVAALALRVAQHLQLDETTAHQIERAAELHDVGKIAVPDAILHKIGALNEDELRFVHEHPIVGERILRAAPSLAPVAGLVRSCHEHWDGSGYPDGLRGTEIPLGARLIAVCDAYHSMRLTHPYRHARTRQQALAELRRCAGDQFDPDMVKALAEVLGRREPGSASRETVPVRREAHGGGKGDGHVNGHRADESKVQKGAGNGADKLRLSEVVSGLSHALDITEGQARGHAERSCVIGMRMAGALGLDDETRSSLFYALLLKDAGCSSNAAKVAALFGADDAVVKSSRRLTDTSSTPEALRHVLRTAGAGSSVLTKGRHVGSVLRAGRAGARSLIELRCERGAAVVRALDLGDIAAQAILDTDEHWDGGGYPAGIAGDEISLGGRVLCIAQTAEVFWGHGGTEAACEIARRRRGTWFDPTLADALVELEDDEEFWDSVQRTSVAALEPPDRVLVADERRLDQVARAFASIIDAKSPYTGHHSDGVATIAVALGDRLGLDTRLQATLRRAALLHDIGKLGVSNLILDKPAPLDPREWEIVRRHPKWTMEIVSGVGVFRDVARIAANHHERLDGSGYHRGLTGDQLDLPSRILAVADAAEALCAERPYRPAFSLEEVLRMTSRAAGRTLDRGACEALGEVLPEWVAQGRSGWPEGIAPR